MDKKVKKKAYSKGMEIDDHIFSVTEKELSRIEMPFEKKKLNFFWWLVVIFMAVLAGKTFYINVIRGEHYQKIARENSIHSLVIKAPRGKVFDKYGDVLVNNFPSMDAIVIPADLPADLSKKKKIADKISEILHVNSGEILGKIENVDQSSFNAFLLKENISQDEYLVLMENMRNFPGIGIEKTAVRDYVDSVIFSHILGYEGKIGKKELENNAGYLLTDYIGKQGLEKSYEKYLRGVHGALQVEVDSLGNVKKERGIVDPKPGSDLILNVDAELQKKIFDSLSTMLEKTQTRTAAAVAINPKNGSVLAMVSFPSFDNNLFSRKISQEDYVKLIEDPEKPLFNRALAGEYPPGSTLKPLIAVAALSEGIVTSSTSVSCSGSIRIGEYQFRDWKTHGATNLEKAIAESCDVYFYSIGGGYDDISGLGMNRMKKYENAFGLGMKTGIDVFGESDGFIPSEEWKLKEIGEKWYIGNSYHASIGQGYILATPLQLTNYIAAIANGGKLFEPHLVSRIKKNDGTVIDIDPKILNETVASSEIIDIVREGMRKTVTEGTAQDLKTVPVEVAGKTGTAQFGTENKTHGWFVSFAPFNDPEIAMVILVEGGGEGHSSAVPVTKEVYDWYFSRKNN